MKRKLDLYLASGLLKQVPDLHDNLPVPKGSQSDIPKDSEVSSDRNRLSSILLINPKSEKGLTGLGENADTSVGGSSDFIYAKALDVQSAKVSERIMTKLQQRARSRKQLYSLSTPVEVKSDVPHEIAKHCQDSESKKTVEFRYLDYISWFQAEGPPHKKNVHCLESNSKNPERTRYRWSAEEDEMLTRMVTKYGLKNWQTIASAIPDRNAQQCRIRWKHSLDPEINKEPWSEQEELTLIRAHQIYGNQWLKMVKHFPGRTNHALKEHWRGPMKGKLNSYLASGLLEQIPDLHEDLSVPDSSQSDIPKDSEGSSDRNLMPPALPKSPKSKQEVTGEGENADSSGGESSDFIYAKGLNAHSAKVSERIIAKSKQRARARRKLDFLSTPVELKVCASAASSQRPLPKSEQMSPDTGNTSLLIVCRDIPPNVPSECVETALSRSANNHPNDIPSSARPEPCSLDIHENSSDHLDMPYCDGLMIDLPSYPHGCSFI
uniref:Uncharacterized protein n=1 Tax=Arundo donax TaxID=35708 RepID=A0A0A9FY27_ARUDO